MNRVPKGANAALSTSGAFTWDLVLDRIWGDQECARILQLPIELLDQGISIVDYLNQVHPEDRPRLARKTHESIVGVKSLSDSHRLLRDDAEPVWVTLRCSCYRIQAGLPTLCSGTLTEVTLHARKPSGTARSGATSRSREDASNR